MATEAQMEMRRANQARYRARHPGRSAAQAREAKARLRADPVAWEAHLERCRIRDRERYPKRMAKLRADPEAHAKWKFEQAMIGRRKRSTALDEPYEPKGEPQTREEMLAKQRAYNMRPDVKAKREAHKKHRRQNPEILAREKELAAKRFQDKKEHIYELRRKWSPETKDKNREWLRNWTNHKRATDIQYRLGNRLRSRLWHALAAQNVRKATATEELVGCSIGFLRGWLESKFVDGMTWENIGEWHIDHVLPCASFDLSDLEQQQKCFHYTNLAPLWAVDNLSKSDSVPEFAV